MYSRTLLNKYIAERLQQQGSNMATLAKVLGLSQSNLTRALKDEKHHLTLPQLAVLAEYLELSGDQVLHILLGPKAGKKIKEAAVGQLAVAAVQRVVKELTVE